jgi:hypothetical protein
VLYNVTTVEPDPRRGEALAGRIEALMSRNEDFATAEVALHLAMALANVAAVEPRVFRRAKLAARIERLQSQDEAFCTPEIDDQLAWVLEGLPTVMWMARACWRAVRDF